MADFAGRPCTLTPEIHTAIIAAIPYVIIPTQVAAHVKISHQKLMYWLKRGGEEMAEDQNSVYSRLFADFKYTQSLTVASLIDKIKTDPEGYKAYSWILEKCFRSDFGADSEELKELRRVFEQILPLISKGAKSG